MLQRPATGSESTRVPARRRSSLALSFAVTLTVSVGVIAGVLMSGAQLGAATCTWVSATTGTMNWTDVTRWNCGTPSIYPGQTGVDTVTFSSPQQQTVQINSAIPNAVTINDNAVGVAVDLTTGGSLTLTGSSNVNTSSTGLSNTFKLTGGTLNMTGATLTIAGGGLTPATGLFSGGTVNGGGTGTIAVGTNANLTFDGAVGTVDLNSVTLNNSGTVNYNTLTNLVSLNGTTVLNNNGTLALISESSIGGTGTINNNLLTKKANSTSGAFTFNTIFNNVAPGNVQFQTTSGTIAFANGGTHTGTFTQNLSTNFEFNGAHLFNSGASITACPGCTTYVQGGTFTDNTGLSIDKLTQNGGTVNGSGALTVSNQFLWAGGSQSGGGSTVLTGSAAVQIVGTVPLTLSNRLLLLGNGGTYNPGAGGSLSIESNGDLRNDGSFLLSGDTPINSADGTGNIDNHGTIQKIGGSGTADLFPIYTATNGTSNTLSVVSGNLRLAGGGTFGSPATTTLDAGSGSFLEIGGTGKTYQLYANTGFTGSGLLKLIDSATLNLNSNLNIGNFAQTGTSTLAGSGSMNLSGTYSWAGGTMDGIGTVTMNGSTPVMDLNGAAGTMTLKNGHQIIANGANVNYTASSSLLHVDSGSSITITGGGSMNLTNNLPIMTDGAGSPLLQINSGSSLVKNAATTSTINPPVNVFGTLHVLSGGVALAGGGTITGNVTTTVFGQTVSVPGPGTVTLSGAPNVSGPGTLLVNGGTLTNSVATTLGSPLSLTGGTINGSGNLTTGSGMVWSGGTMQGPGTTTIAVANTLDATAPTQPLTLDARPLVVNGTFQLNPAQNLSLNNGSTLTIGGTGVFDAQGDGNLLTNGIGTNSVVNGGTIKKTAGTSGFRFDVPITNNGTIDSQAGGGSTIIVNGGGTFSAGNLNALSGANLDFFNGTSTISGGTLTGAGAIRITGGGAVVHTTSILSAPPNFQHNFGTLIADATFGIPASAVYSWNGGSIAGTAGVSVALNGALNMDSSTAPLTLSSTTITTQPGGSLTWTGGANQLALANGAAINNGGTFDLRTGAATLASTGTGGTISNSGSGILRRSTNTGLVDVQTPVTSSATIDVLTATLRLSGGATNSGTVNVASGAALDVPAASTVALNLGSALTGTGAVQVAGGTLNVNTALTSGNQLKVGAGNLTLNAPLTMTGPVTWTGGTINGTAGISADNITITPATSNPTLTGATFTNNGSATLNGSSSTVGLLIGGGGTFQNTSFGTFLLTGDRPILRSGASTINNAGIFQKTAGTGTSAVAPDFHNSGAVDVFAGDLAFSGNGTDTGTYNSTAVGSILEFAGGTRSISSPGGIAIGIPGTLLVTGGTLTDSATFTPAGTVTINGGALLYNGASQANFQNALTVAGGTLGGSGALRLSGTGLWSGGTLTGSGPLRVDGTLTVNSPTANALLDGKTIDVYGTANYTSAAFPLIMSNGAAINPQSGGTFNIGTLGIPIGSGSASITNFGTLAKIGNGTSTIAPSYLTNGTTVAQVGTLDFSGGFTQSIGTTKLSGGILSGSPMTFNGGTLTGTGNIVTATLQNNGAVVSPGDSVSVGTIGVVGNYMATGGALQVRIAGPGSNDQLSVGGSADVAGNLDVSFLGPYRPTGGEQFPLLTYTSVNGDFNQPYNLPSLPAGTWASAYTSNALVLTAVASSSADLAVTTSGPTAVGALQSATYSVSVANAGPDPAATNTLNVTVTNGTLLTANAPAGGWNCGTLTAASAICTLASIPNGGSAPLTLTVQAPASGTITVNASVSSNTPDPSTPNNSESASTLVSQNADLSISKSGPTSANTNTNATYSILVQNLGPAAAMNVVVNDPAPSGTTFVSAAGPCSSFPCTIPTLAAGSSASFSAVFHITAGSGTITNTATVSSASTPDPVTSNNSSSISTSLPPTCPLTPVSLLPADGVTNIPLSGMLNWNAGSGAQQYNVYLGVAGSGCSTLYGSTPGHQMQYFDLQPGTQYEWRVEGVSPSCPVVTSICAHFTTTSNCNSQPPALLSPADGAVVSTPVTFAWSAVTGAATYDLFAVPAGATPALLGTTAGTSLTAAVPSGPGTWYVVAHFANGSTCGPLQSPARSFNACGQLAAPVPSVIGQASTNQTYTVEWTPVAGATRYQIDEATNAAFNGATSQTVTATKVSFTHAAPQSATPFFYRVRAFQDCSDAAGPYSNTVRVVIVPLPPKNQVNPSVNVPAGSTRVVVQQVFIEGIPDAGTYTYSATVDKPWLAVTPPTGLLPVDGVTLDVTANPAELPNGTFTGTVLVTITQLGAGNVATHAAGSKAVPVSINLVTPITTGPGSSPQANSLIIPSVGHLDGVNSQWQSDIRVTNPSSDKQRYQLIFTPQGDDGIKNVKTTTIDVAAGDTTALDDIVRNWYGIGSLGDSANGMLEIRPLSASGKGLDANDTTGSKVTAVASSRTYNVSGNGTLGQFIPAVPFASFIARNADPKLLGTVLSLQQVAQSEAFRTNVGVVEASGAPASVLLSVFDNSGLKLKDIPLELKAGEQRQLNGFLAANGITSLADGRITATVTNGSGKVTAYASVIDNRTGDPLLVSGVPLSASSNNKYVLPGVADLNNGLASWRTDMRIFNNSTTPQAASLLFYPQNNSGDALTKAVTINPGEVRTLDNVLQSLFEATNTGGAVHITTPGDSSLVVTGRTYNQTQNGTFGQFINAVTPFDAVGRGDRSLQILQVEDSVRYRTNLGLAEVSGRAANVEVTVFLPDSKVTPKIAFTLQPNEFRQLGIIRDLGLGNAYNARISVRVTDGDGRVTAYGSVIDMITQDPTYVPAQ